MTETKSVITCDLEGRIETFSEGAEVLFGWKADDIVGKKRVSFFSPGLVVLEHVETWLKSAVKDGEFSTRTVFLQKSGGLFPAEIKITPTKKDGVHIGYCGVTRALPDVSLADASPKISPATRIFSALVITRAPFLTVTLIPILAAFFYLAHMGLHSTGALLTVALIGGVALHVAANTFNDYFDWKSGADLDNNEYFLPFSGGSRAIELGLITPRGLLGIAIGSIVTACACGAYLVSHAGLGVLIFGVVGALIAYFYTAPPIYFAGHGLGELMVALCFGPLMTAGTAFALTGQAPLAAYLVGIPVGLLTAAILWINEFPDAPSDERMGKRTLVVMLGIKNARWGYFALVLGAFGMVVAGIAAGLFPVKPALVFLTAPLAFQAVKIVMQNYQDRTLVRASKSTVMLHLVFGILFIAGCYF